MTSQYQLIAQIRSTGPARGYPVTIGTFESESECRAAYRQAMREKLDGGYSEDVLDFAIQVPTAASRERTAEADQMDGLLALLGGVGDTQPSAREELGVLSGSGISQLAFAEFAQER